MAGKAFMELALRDAEQKGALSNSVQGLASHIASTPVL